MTKKFFAILLALVLTFAMSTVAFAATSQSKDASFTKTYKITNADTSNPEETFTFSFTADRVTNSNANLTKDNMPAIPNSTVTFNQGTATTAGYTQNVAVALSSVNWPGVGVYYYTVKEVAGNTAGVTYSNTAATLKVTVAYDQGTNTYYTAFVTLSLDDDNHDGITDTKTAGFENVYSAGKLSITKKVTGNMADQDKYFDVKVTLNGESGKTYANSYAVTGGSNQQNPTSIAIGTETTFKLKHDDTIVIENLPYGVTYTVVEADYTSEANGGYDTPSYVFSDETDKKINTAEDTVVITNNKSTTVDTGITMDSMPYIVLLALAVVGLAAVTMKKRYEA